MQGHKDNEQITDHNSKMELAILTVLGDREDQQDSFGYELKQDDGLVVVCDGMGGYEGGKLASSIAVDEFLSAFNREYPCNEPVLFLDETTHRANNRISALKSRDGQALHAGSTLVALLILGEQMYWSSVGDSRAYLLRGGEFVQFTLDHNYKTVLQEKKNAGLIDEEEYASESSRAEALISFLGIGDLKLIDYNDEAFHLMKDDKIVIMSDGLYKLVPEEEIFRVADNFNNSAEALQALEMKARKSAKSGMSRDNMTVAMIKIK